MIIYYQTPYRDDGPWDAAGSTFSRKSIEAAEVDDTDAALCAEEYFHHHDGWEATWPMTFLLSLKEDGSDAKRFSVGMEYDPTFTGTAVP